MEFKEDSGSSFARDDGNYLQQRTNINSRTYAEHNVEEGFMGEYKKNLW